MVHHCFQIAPPDIRHLAFCQLFSRFELRLRVQLILWPPTLSVTRSFHVNAAGESSDQWLCRRAVNPINHYSH